MPDEQLLVAHIFQHILRPKTMAGKKVLITAGPTCEPLDPVRYLTNHSSGKMGYALAKECSLRGAQVTLSPENGAAALAVCSDSRDTDRPADV